MIQGFDNDKYIKIQSERIKERITHFQGKLYLELGGKLFDDYHASRVLPEIPWLCFDIPAFPNAS